VGWEEAGLVDHSRLALCSRLSENIETPFLSLPVYAWSPFIFAWDTNAICPEATFEALNDAENVFAPAARQNK
jgi:hypothetical protein